MMIAIYLLREILRLLHSKIPLSYHRIEELTGCPHQTVGRINKRFKRSKLSFAEVENLNDSALQLALYPKVKSKPLTLVLPNIDAIIEECLKKVKRRKSIMVMYLQYKALYGDKGYGRAQFYKLVREALKKRHVVMKQLYVPGEILFIDCAGLTLQYRYGKKSIKLYVFIARLGYSNRLFAFAARSMKSANWCEALYKALEYFDGVPDVVQFDNAKAMVTTPGQLAVFHKDVTELMSYCGCIGDTSRVATPTDNGPVENAVKFITQRVLVPMSRDLTFFSLDEVNRYLVAEVDKLNNEPCQKNKLSPNEMFFASEQQALSLLPATPYKPTLVRKEVHVPANYLIHFESNEYSVPYHLAHELVEVKVKGNELIVLHKSKECARHTLVDGINQVIRLDEHLKPEHKAELNKTQENYLDWATSVGSATVKVVKLQYKGLKNRNSRAAGKYCARLQKLCKKYGSAPFEQACIYATTHSMHSPNDIELILKAKPFDTLPKSDPIDHENIRGARYFDGEDHE